MRNVMPTLDCGAASAQHQRYSLHLLRMARANSPVLSVVNNAGDLLEPIGVVPVNQIFAMVVSRTEEVPQTVVA